jgi:hypothetical protein
MFQLTRAEFEKLKEQSANSSQIVMSSGKHAALTSQIAISKRGRGGRRTFKSNIKHLTSNMAASAAFTLPS